MSSETPATSGLPVASPSSICALLTWKDPVATGKVLAVILAALLSVKINIFNHLFHLAYVGLLVSAAAEYSGRILTGHGFVTKYLGKPKSHSRTFRDSVLPVLADAAEALESHVYRVGFAQDLESTLKAAGISYIMYKLTSWFSLYSLVFAAVLLAFSGPYIYTNNQKEIDAAVAQYTKCAKAKTTELTACAKSKMGPHLDALAKKTGPVGSFIQSKFPTRTAGSTVGPNTTPATPSTATTTGASKFPDVPSSAPQTVHEFVDEKSTLEPNL